MRILFAGSPAIAVPSLEMLLCGDFTLAGLLTGQNSPRGRSSRLEPTDCARFLEKQNVNEKPSVTILKPEKLNGPVRDQIAALKPDLLVSFAYGKIFGPKFLSLFPLGGINIHPSLLPKYRGPTPIPAAILGRETETGITIQKLAPETDSGDILIQETIPLGGRETSRGLSETMAKKSALLLPAVLQDIARGKLQARAQDHNSATYCSLIKKEDGIINWNTGAAEIDAGIRAYDPWPLCRTFHGGQELLILKAEAITDGELIHQYTADGDGITHGRVLGKNNERGILIQTGNGILAVSLLQYRTKKALEWKAFLNGARNFIGAKLGQ